MDQLPDMQSLDANARMLQVFQIQKEKSASLRTESIKGRKERLKKIKSWIWDHRTDIQKAVFEDFQKPAVEVDLTETYAVLSELNHALKNLHRWTKPKRVATPITFIGTRTQVFMEPKGVCLIVAPWNFPFNLSIGPLVSAIAAGNTAIIKPSELSPHTSNLIQRMAEELFDISEVAVFQGDAQIAQNLLKLPFDHIFFTGSPAVGKIVMRAAAEHLTSVTLELGGKSPLIVHSSADLDDLARKLAWGKFINNGQTCIAPDYVLVPESMQAELVARLKRWVEKLFNSTGNGFEKSADYSRLINSKHYDRISWLVKDAIDGGAHIEMGGSGNPANNYFPPTIVTNINPDSALLQEEIFGPVLPILTYDQEHEVVEFINSRPKPLALYVFSQDHKFNRFIRNSCSAGTSCINETVAHFLHPNIPFGGVNHSGIGKSHGHQGFVSFSNEKPILRQRTGFTAFTPLYPPYNKNVRGLINLLLKYF